ncbi:hypothetical protein [Nocardioides sp.]|uniref:glycoside hydrolase family 16 protein n=1 Tax=Nocardioides sp. TaxID=35761 RepID=UPI003526F15E
MTFPLRRGAVASLLGGVLAAAAMAAPVVSGGSAAPTPVTASPRLASGGYTCTGYCKHPTNAAKVFKWGSPKWGDEFEVSKLNRKKWRSDHPKRILSKGGMLTIKAKGYQQQITTWGNQSARYGRWEARVRIHERPGATGEHYVASWMLEPTGGDHCGASEVTLAQYAVDDARVSGWVRTLDDNEFRYSRATRLSNLAWHTYAIEITPKRISWFSDTKVLRTEKRPAALSGVKLRPQFVLAGLPDTEMRETWLQMDWVRFYSLERKNAKSTKATQMTSKTYADGC